MTTVTISSDPSYLSPACTSDDLLRYAGRLAALLTSEFGEVEVELGSTAKVVCHTHSPEKETSIEERIEDLERGNGWLALAFGE